MPNLMLSVSQGLVFANPDGNLPRHGAFMNSLGGAVMTVSGSANTTICGSEFNSNSAGRAKFGNMGGALACFGGSLRLENASFIANSAVGGFFSAFGGAIISIFSEMTISDAEFRGNTVRAIQYAGAARTQYSSGGAMYMQFSKATLLRTRFISNMARGAVLVNGGAIECSESGELIMEESLFLDNHATNGSQTAHGGAIRVTSGASARFAFTLFISNMASNGRAQASGGAIAISTGAVTLGPGVKFINNSVHNVNGVGGSGLQSKASCGGAISDADFPTKLTAQESPIFVGNLVEGVDASGGAIYLQSPDGVVIAGAVFEDNTVRVLGGYGKGGALFVDGGSLQLLSCMLRGNIAEMALRQGVYDVTAGAIYVDLKGELTLRNSYLASNEAGGTGMNENVGILAATAANNRACRAAHVFVLGTAIIDNCTIEDAGGKLPNRASWWFVVEGFAGIRNSSLLSEGNAGLLSFKGSTGQALIRDCIGRNIRVNGKSCGVDSAQQVQNIAEDQLGIVRSTFQPALDAGLPMVRPPFCGRKVADEYVCDARAACQTIPAGGVTCSCEDPVRSLSAKPGYPNDGQKCQQRTTADLKVQASEYRGTLQKPGGIGRPLQTALQVRGENSFNATYRVRMHIMDAASVTENDRSLRNCLGNVSISRSWQGKGTRAVEWHGLRLVWSQRPEFDPFDGQPQVSLDADKQAFSFFQQHQFDLLVECAPGESTCPGDGDLVLTEIEFDSVNTPSDKPIEIPKAIHLCTDVQALPSCKRLPETVSVVHGEAERPGGRGPQVLAASGEVLHDDDLVKVQLRALDVEGHPINYTHVGFSVTWKALAAGVVGSEVAVQRVGHDPSSYTAEIGLGKRSEPGMYQLEAVVRGWDGSGDSSFCTVVNRTITVLCNKKAGFELERASNACVTSRQAELWLGLALGAAFCVCVGGLLFMLYRAAKRDKKRARQLLLWFFRGELTLLGEAFAEVWGTASINTCFFLVIQRTSYTELSAPYAVLIFVASVCSLVSVGAKIRWLYRKVRSRHLEHSTTRPSLINAVRTSGRRLELQHVVEMERLARMWESLRERDDLQQIDRERLISYVVLAVAQEYAPASFCPLHLLFGATGPTRPSRLAFAPLCSAEVSSNTV